MLPALRDLPQLRLVIPIPPSSNNLFLNVNGRVAGKSRVKGAKYRAWLHDAGWAARAAAGSCHFARPVRILVEADLSGRRDLDNALKPILDLLVYMHILADDSLVNDLRIVRRGSKTEAAVSIWPM
jgi:crossover junction endodeoxyribonuclease RusA